jgi:hypothetical protein
METVNEINGILQILDFCIIRTEYITQAQGAEQNEYCMQCIEMFRDKGLAFTQICKM